MPGVPSRTQSGMICSSWNALCRNMYRLKRFSTSPRSAAFRARRVASATCSRSRSSSLWSWPTDAPATVSVMAARCAASGRHAGGLFDGPAHQRVLLLDESDRVRLAEVLEGVTLPLAGEVALVPALHELAHDA